MYSFLRNNSTKLSVRTGGRVARPSSTIDGVEDCGASAIFFSPARAILRNESGIALIITLFVIAVATILIAEITDTGRLDQRFNHALSESIQADYALKSVLNFGLVLLEIPNWQKTNVTWKGEYWSRIGTFDTLPIDGIGVHPRLLITDNAGKIDLNLLVEPTYRNAQSNGKPPPDAERKTANFWRNATETLFSDLGFKQENYGPDSNRTVGNVGFGPCKLVTSIVDWTDVNSQPFSDPDFDCEGVEGSEDSSAFYNRPLKKIDDLLLVPGFTSQRLAMVAPYVRAGSGISTGSTSQINVNTAPDKVLRAVLPASSQSETFLGQILAGRESLPVDQETLNSIIAAFPDLRGKLTLTSNSFSIYAMIEMNTVRRWLTAQVEVSGDRSARIIVQSPHDVEFY